METITEVGTTSTFLHIFSISVVMTGAAVSVLKEKA